MQKQNPVIKNYILSSQKRFLTDKDQVTDNLKYHELLEQNTVCAYRVLLRIE